MKVYFAPLEGVTTYPFRLAHARHFAPPDKYFAPFMSPTQEHHMAPRDVRELCPEHNEGVNTVPQLLGKNAGDIVWAIGELAAMGYREVNLNLGCPSGTVVAKGKGCGLLAKPEELDAFLDAVYSAAKCAVSIKTRLGIGTPEEFHVLAETYNRYPVSELTVHARVQKDMYKYPARMDFFAEVLPELKMPVCYNGDVTRRGELDALAERFPRLSGAMVGRGFVANLALLGGEATVDAIRAFHGEIYEACARDFGSAKSAVFRMKELWSYMKYMFADHEKHIKRLNKAKAPADYLSAAEDIFRELPLSRDPAFPILPP